jgi:hypothetical protein
MGPPDRGRLPASMLAKSGPRMFLHRKPRRIGPRAAGSKRLVDGGFAGILSFFHEGKQGLADDGLGKHGSVNQWFLGSNADVLKTRY